MDMFELTVPQLKHALGNLDRWLERGAEHAKTKEIPVEQLLTARLAPDQYTLTRQVQVATDNAKFIPARLSAKEWPPHPDTETTFEQLHDRIESVRGYLDTFQPTDFEGAADRMIILPWMAKGQHMRAADYMVQFGMPNFYFHIVTAYGILRNQGVQLAKMDYIGPITIQR